MANKTLFASLRGKLMAPVTGLNAAEAPAYIYSPQHKMAQLAVTGCMNGTFYAAPEDQLNDVLGLAKDVDPAFLVKLAIYARRSGFMKDMPALLLALLSAPVTKGESGTDYLAPAFSKVVDNGKMLRNFVQIMRSGVVGRKSLGTAPKRLVQQWLINATDAQLINASVGKNPSLADVIKMVHPKPKSLERAALFAYLIGRECNVELLPQAITDFETFKREGGEIVPDVPFQMLTSLTLTKQHWLQVARRSGWHMNRMNLNTFARKGVFEIEGAAQEIAERLRNKEAIKKARVFPYQLMVAYQMSGGPKMPAIIGEALQDALETSLANVPVFNGNVVICPDVSGSMSSPVTGYQRGRASAVRCIDVASLFTSVILQQSKTAEVLPFDDRIRYAKLNRRDSIMSNARKLAAIQGGATDCSIPLKLLNKQRAKVDLVIFVSDNQSWADERYGTGTAMMHEWNRLKVRSPDARMICIDIQPYGSSQAAERDDILNIGGFSDQVFKVIEKFTNNRLAPKHWLGEIEQTNERMLN